MPLFIFLSHDVDWPRHGPGIDHIMARKERFDNDIIKRVISGGYNPYFGIPELMDAEDSLGMRSTFFFRPVYDDGTDVGCYSDVIKELLSEGWEIGVHLNDVSSVNSIRAQKEKIEEISGRTYGCRVHYLRINADDYRKIRDAGFLYDSSLKKFRDRIELEDMGHYMIDGVTVFPVTIMDAYLFTNMNVKEEKVINLFNDAINRAIKGGKNVITVLWHDSSIKMRGGRAYKKVLEFLASRQDLAIVRGVDLLRRV
jgi:peptidoglycan/xylan/chitin deacetylase (PgdA/CDA1 family)